MNNDYQVLKEELGLLKNRLEINIFDENIDFESKKSMIVKRNAINNFIELPDDLIDAVSLGE